MKAIVNEGCIGCGLCASTCPAVFTLEDGVAVAMAGDIPSRSSGPKNRIAPLRRPAMRFLPVCGRACSCPFGAKCAETAAVAASPPVSAPPVRVHTAAHIHCSSFSRSSLLYVSGSSRRGP